MFAARGPGSSARRGASAERTLGGRPPRSAVPTGWLEVGSLGKLKELGHKGLACEGSQVRPSRVKFFTTSFGKCE